MEIIFADKSRGYIKEITANSIRVPFHEDRGPCLYYKQNGEQIRIEMSEAENGYKGSVDGVDYSLSYTDCGDHFKMTATLTNNNPEDFIPEAVGLKLGLDTYMIEYPQWNEVFFPTLLRCEKTHFWGYFMSPLKQIVSVCCDSPVAAWELDYNTIVYDGGEDYGHRIYTANLLLLCSDEVPERHPQNLNKLAAGETKTWEVNLMPRNSLDAYRETLSEKFSIPVVDAERYSYYPGEEAKIKVYSDSDYKISTVSPSGEIIDGNSFRLDEYGVYTVTVKTESGKECQAKLHCRHDYSWYLKNARVNAVMKPQKASTHVESWYGHYSAALARKHFPDADLDKKIQDNFDEIMPLMFNAETGEINIIPQRIQNTSGFLSLLADKYEADKENGRKYLDWANLMAEDLLRRQTPDGAYRNKHEHYTAVIYIAKGMLELALCEKELAESDPEFAKRYEIHYNSVKAAVDDLVNLLETIGTEGEGTLEDGMISCSALQIGFFALTLPEEERGKYIEAAEHLISLHRCLEQMVIPDCRMRGASLRFWEAQYDIMMQGNMFNSPHGWTSWKNYATYYLYLLTGKEEYLRQTIDAIGTCMQCMDEDGDLRWAFIVDPVINVERLVPDLDNPCPDGLKSSAHLTTQNYRGKYERLKFGESYVPMISDWYRTGPNELMTGGYLKCPLIFENSSYMSDNQGGCCDNDVHEHFKCMEETVFRKAFVLVREDMSLLYYNCKASLENGALAVEAFDEANKLHINTKAPLKIVANGKEFNVDAGMIMLNI